MTRSAVVEILQGLKILKDVAEALLEIHKVFEDELNDTLNELLKDLQDLRLDIVVGVNKILEALGEIAHQIDQDVALDNWALADRALFSDLVEGSRELAMGNSRQAAVRLRSENDVLFAVSFMYVVNVRLAVLKHFEPGFPCNPEYRDEIQRHIDHLKGWVTQLNDFIREVHTVVVERINERVEEAYPPEFLRYWQATHLRDGLIVQVFVGDIGDLSPATRARVERQANASREDGVDADRHDLGVVNLEATARAWAATLGTSLRLALVTQVLNRPIRAVDFNPHGLMVDGEILSDELDLKTTLIALLSSREFRSQLQRTWDAFVDRGDDALVKFAHQRLFDREATEAETEVLRQVARQYGYEAFIAVLLYSDEYEQRFGRGLPAGGRPIAEELALHP